MVKLNREVSLKWAAPAHKARSTRDAARAVNSDCICVEKGKDSSRLALVLTLASAAAPLRAQNCKHKRDDGIL